MNSVQQIFEKLVLENCYGCRHNKPYHHCTSFPWRMELYEQAKMMHYLEKKARKVDFHTHSTPIRADEKMDWESSNKELEMDWEDYEHK